jgi:glycosyltransferase involved in cell wall biosynthesis
MTAIGAPIRVCLYSPADLNLVSGSSIWVQAVAETLHAGPNVHVTIPLMAPERRTIITDLLRRLPRVELVDPRRQLRFVPPTGLYSTEILDLIEKLDRDQPFDHIVLRSFPYCRAALGRPSLRGRLWSTYILEPERDVEDPEHLADLAAIADASEYVVVQSEEMRALFEALVPAGRGRTIILPPAVPPVGPEGRTPAPRRERLIYAGKFHPFYPVTQMTGFLTELRATHPDLEFHVLGDQVFRSPAHAAWADELERALTTTDGVAWHGALARDEVNRFVGQGGIALSLWDYRHGSRINDLVVSTKLLDYCAAGVPVVCNRTAAQETVLGEDYPLFVREPAEALPLLRRLLEDAELYADAAARCVAAAERYTYPRVHADLAPYLEGRPDGPLRTFDRPKLPDARFNLGLLDADETAVRAAHDLLAELRGDGGPWRLIVGRTGEAPEPGADPAGATLPRPPEALRDAVSVRTVDDVRNWWRTVGVALVVAPDGTAAAPAREAMASGAVPIAPDDPGAPEAVRRLADAATWSRESEAARSAALASIGG